jgi:ketosteroid isomerase-like protein
MSEENVAAVRRLVDALSAGDYDRAAAELHSAAEWHNTAAFPGPRRVTGAERIRDFWADLFDAYGATAEDSGIEVERIAESGDSVVVLLHGWGHGRSSGIPFDTRWAHALRVNQGKIDRVATYGTYERALAAAELSEA